MLELSCRAGFLEKRLDALGRRQPLLTRHFDGHMAFELSILRKEHAAKAALAQLSQDPVAANHVGEWLRIDPHLDLITARVLIVVVREILCAGRTGILGPSVGDQSPASFHCRRVGGESLEVFVHLYVVASRPTQINFRSDQLHEQPGDHRRGYLGEIVLNPGLLTATPLGFILTAQVVNLDLLHKGKVRVVYVSNLVVHSGSSESDMETSR